MKRKLWYIVSLCTTYANDCSMHCLDVYIAWVLAENRQICVNVGHTEHGMLENLHRVMQADQCSVRILLSTNTMKYSQKGVKQAMYALLPWHLEETL